MNPNIERRYFDAHFPHRINVLQTFKERFGPSASRYRLNTERFRDFHRCAKDAAMMMVRNFCEVFGWSVKGTNATRMEYYAPRPDGYLVVHPTKVEAENSKDFAAVEMVCVTANKCIAHNNRMYIEDGPSDEELCAAIDQITEWVELLYRDNGANLRGAMSLPENEMHRDRALA